MAKILALKIDVDTERGTRIGVNQLLELFTELGIKATFLYSLGPDNTGRAIKRIFRKGFLKKVSRTSVLSTYGLRTLMNGVLLPGPHIARKHATIMRRSAELGHEVGIHSYDHVKWQDNLFKMTPEKVNAEFTKALDAFKTAFSFAAKTAGSAGWQANANSLQAYDDAKLNYGSDCRGQYPFIPKIGAQIFKTPQLPTTLPTLDELLGRPEYPEHALSDFYLSQLRDDRPNIFTMHAEIEGMKHIDWFKSFLQKALATGVIFQTTAEIASKLEYNTLPVCEFYQGTIEGRSGTLAVQGD